MDTKLQVGSKIKFSMPDGLICNGVVEAIETEEFKAKFGRPNVPSYHVRFNGTLLAGVHWDEGEKRYCAGKEC